MHQHFIGLTKNGTGNYISIAIHLPFNFNHIMLYTGLISMYVLVYSFFNVSFQFLVVQKSV